MARYGFLKEKAVPQSRCLLALEIRLGLRLGLSAAELRVLLYLPKGTVSNLTSLVQ